MSDEKPPGQPFTWGLRPSGDDEPPPTPPPEPVDQGYFAALDADSAIEPPPAFPPPAFPPPSPVGEPPIVPPFAPPSPADVSTQAMATPVPPGGDEGEPTQAFAFDAPAPPVYEPPAYEPPAWNPWEPPPLDDALEGPSNALVAQPVGLEPPVGESAPTSAIDALFGDGSFQAYDAGLGPSPFAAKAVATIPGEVAHAVPREPRQPLGRGQQTLIWVAGGLVAAIALTGLFLAGRELAPVLAPAPVAAPSPSPSATLEAPVTEALGPIAAGVHQWDDLLGTECIDPFTSAWDEEFTVVDCTTPHAAQLVYRGRFDDPKLAEFPGVEALQSRMSLLCTLPTAIDYAAASQFGDIQFAASHAANEEDWVAGNRNYFCFVTRSTGEPLATSVALPDVPTPVIPVEPAPEP